jgi:hypothetical protein
MDPAMPRLLVSADNPGAEADLDWLKLTIMRAAGENL